MKQCLSIALMLLFFFACSSPGTDGIRTGDLLFCGYQEAPGGFTAAGAIAASTGGFVHVAILEVRGDSTWVIDATMKRGVARYPLDTLLHDYLPADGLVPVLVVKRLREGFREEFIERAKSFVGAPYDYYFMPDNGKMYCSELVQECYRGPAGEYLFDSKPMNFKDSDGRFPAYWLQLYAGLGEPVPQDMPGTNPQDMSESPLLEDVPMPVPGRFSVSKVAHPD